MMAENKFGDRHYHYIRPKDEITRFEQFMTHDDGFVSFKKEDWNEVQIIYINNIDRKEFVDEYEFKNSDVHVLFSLIGFVVYDGNAQFGHYHAFTKY